MLWDLNEGKHLYSLEAGDNINALVFSPNRYWLCAATASCIKIFDLCVLLPLARSSFSRSVADQVSLSPLPPLLSLARTSSSPPPLDSLALLAVSTSPLDFPLLPLPLSLPLSPHSLPHLFTFLSLLRHRRLASTSPSPSSSTPPPLPSSTLLPLSLLLSSLSLLRSSPALTLAALARPPTASRSRSSTSSAPSSTSAPRPVSPSAPRSRGPRPARLCSLVTPTVSSGSSASCSLAPDWPALEEERRKEDLSVDWAVQSHCSFAQDFAFSLFSLSASFSRASESSRASFV